MTNTSGILDFEMEQTAVELQHISVKFLLRDPASVDLEAVVPLFHTWIQGQVFEELLLDVADYSHVPDGPGVMLIGHEADYAVDNTDGRLGVRYSRKAPLPGANRDRLIQAARAALRAAERLEQELNLHLTGRDIGIVVNDRLLAPNTDGTRKAAESELRSFLELLFGGPNYSLAYSMEPRRLFGVTARAGTEASIQTLMGNLNPAANQ